MKERFSFVTRMTVIAVVFQLFAVVHLTAQAITDTGTEVGILTTTPKEELQIGDRWTFHNGGSKVIGYNYYFNTSPLRIVNDEVSIMSFDANGNIQFSFAPAGAANSTFTPVPGLFMHNNGRLGIGNVNPGAALDIVGKNAIPLQLYQEGPSGQLTTLQMFAAPGGTTTPVAFHVGAIQAKCNGTNSTNSYFSLNPINTNGTGLAQGLTVYAGGKVGIGIDAPDTKLSIYDLQTSTGKPNVNVKITNFNATLDNNSGSAIEFATNIGVGKVAGIDERTSPTGTYQGGLAFFTRLHTAGNDGGFYERMRIRHDGKVGIGTNDPQATLHVVGGNLQINNQWLSTLQNNTLGVGHGNAGSGVYVGALSIGYDYGTLGAAMDNTQNAFIAGKMGIGTTSPQSSLHVVGKVQINDQWISTYPNNTLGVGHGEAGSGLYAGALSIGYDYGSLGTALDNTQNAYIAGKVGIGTTSLGSMSLAVHGKIGAREVNVTLDAWPDYVFEADYELMPLTEIEKFIKQNKHLPNVPTAVDVKNEGVDLGEMNAILLQKIEELTLYVIEQNKELLEQKQEIQNQQELIEKQMKLVDQLLQDQRESK